MDNNVSFKSKIKFVNSAEFMNKVQNSTSIEFYDPSKNIVKSKEFHTFGLRTCSGGGLTNSREAVGFHLLDSEENLHYLYTLFYKMFFNFNADRGVLIGGKSGKYTNSSISTFLFDSIKTILSQNVKHLSYFQEHNDMFSQTHCHYSSKYDTWTLCSQTIINEPNVCTNKTINSIDELKKFYKKIHIAKGDRLFIGGKEILPKDHPELFAK